MGPAAKFLSSKGQQQAAMHSAGRAALTVRRRPDRSSLPLLRGRSTAPPSCPLRAFVRVCVCVCNCVLWCVRSALPRVFLSHMSTFVRTKPHLNIGTIGHVDHGQNNSGGDDSKGNSNCRRQRHAMGGQQYDGEQTEREHDNDNATKQAASMHS